jgi:hypothetical protein
LKRRRVAFGVCIFVVAAAITVPVIVTGGPKRTNAGSQSGPRPPSSINATCETDVSPSLQAWINGVPAGSTWKVPERACYLVNEGIDILDPRHLTIDGGIFERTSDTTDWSTIDVVGGSDTTLEHVTIDGPNAAHAYVAAHGFESGIILTGTISTTLEDITVNDVWGDALTLSPYRANGQLHDESGDIVRPNEDLRVEGFDVDGTGRAGMGLISVVGATITNVTMRNVADDDFDLEADQATEQARRITIDGCDIAPGGLLFFSNQGLGNGDSTGDVTVENCTMAYEQGGTAILSENDPGQTGIRGPFTFINDTIRCAPLAPVACMQLSGTHITISDSRIVFSTPGLDTPTEAVYSISRGSTVVLSDDTVTGYGTRGSVDSTSKLTVTGGIWSP